MRKFSPREIETYLCLSRVIKDNHACEIIWNFRKGGLNIKIILQLHDKNFRLVTVAGLKFFHLICPLDVFCCRCCYLVAGFCCYFTCSPCSGSY